MSCESEAMLSAPIALTLPGCTISITLPSSGSVVISDAADVILDTFGEPVLDEASCFLKNE